MKIGEPQREWIMAKSLKPKAPSRQRLYQIRHKQQNLCHLDSRPALGSDVKYGWLCARHAQQHAARHNRKYRKWTVADKALFLELWQEGVRGRTLALLFDISEVNVYDMRRLWKLQPRRKKEATMMVLVLDSGEKIKVWDSKQSGDRAIRTVNNGSPRSTGN